MKLSEAIRQGAKLHPQCFYGMYEYIDGQVVASCAMGAAFVAIFPVISETPSFGDLQAELDIDLNQKITHPTKAYNKGDVIDIVTDLNDHARWSREKIADWLSGIGL